MLRTNLVNIRVFEVDDEYRVDIVDRADDNIYEAFLYQKDEADKTLILRENKSSDDEETALVQQELQQEVMNYFQSDLLSYLFCYYLIILIYYF